MPAEKSPELSIRQMITGYWIAQAVYVAAKLGLADLLEAGPKDCKQLATATSSHAPACTDCCACSPAWACSARMNRTGSP